jgi:hypothetical protein
MDNVQKTNNGINRIINKSWYRHHQIVLKQNCTATVLCYKTLQTESGLNSGIVFNTLLCKIYYASAMNTYVKWRYTRGKKSVSY